MDVLKFLSRFRPLQMSVYRLKIARCWAAFLVFWATPGKRDSDVNGVSICTCHQFGIANGQKCLVCSRDHKVFTRVVVIRPLRGGRPWFGFVQACPYGKNKPGNLGVGWSPMWPSELIFPKYEDYGLYAIPVTIPGHEGDRWVTNDFAKCDEAVSSIT